VDKSISSQPEAAKFRSIAAIILVLICISVFFSYTEHLSEKAESIARDRVITDIRYSLAMMLYDYTIQGKQDGLKKFNNENPFIPLAIYRSLPGNYRGVISELSTNIDDGWYFVKSSRTVIYTNFNGDRQMFTLKYYQNEAGAVGQLKLEEVLK